ncbi:MAG TPA: hypothetical protein VGW78_02010 [Candidatus Babeliales bacterium]|jgi:hypothetical protein|nr:hypothetical protein [Candidatus Babeliales bacterium]
MNKHGNVYQIIMFALGISTYLIGTNEIPLEETKVCCAVSNPCCPTNSLTLCTLKADAIGACCLQAERVSAGDVCANRITTNQFCTPSLNIDTVCANNAQIKNMCAHHVQIDELCALKAMINQLCARQAYFDNACIKNLRFCSNISARASQSTLVTYNLGDDLPFDTVEYDPSSSITQAPTEYTAPEAGVYEITVQVVFDNLTGPTIIAGTPKGSLELYINGLIRRAVDTPFLMFTTSSQTFLTTLIFLNAGDVVTSKYQIFVLDPNVGVIAYPGKIELLGNPNPAAYKPVFYIQYVSSDCEGTFSGCDSICDLICQTTPCVVECTPCTPMQCQPCFAPCPPCTPCGF